MRRFISLAVLSTLAIIGLASAQAPTPPFHIMTTPNEVAWGEPPPAFERGAFFAVMAGDPGAEEPFVVRMKVPAGYSIKPHWHPTDEQVTVLSGTFSMGMGEKFNKAALKDLPAGSFALMPAEMRHFAVAKTDALIQVHGMGPFTLTYVDPADDPRKRPPAN